MGAGSRIWCLPVAALVIGVLHVPSAGGGAHVSEAGGEPGVGVGVGGEVVPELLGLIEKLGSEEWAERERAMVRIQTDRAFGLAELERALRALSPSLEQRVRLLEAARARFRATPRGAMGIRADTRREQGRGVPVVPIEEPGFHAHKVLEAGDRIIEADGLPIRVFDDLRVAILRHDAGAMMDVVVLREGRRVAARVRLGDYGALSGAAPLEPHILERAWSIRSSGYDLASVLEGRAVDTGLSETTWAKLGAQESARGRDERSLPAAASGGRVVRVGNEGPASVDLRVGGGGRAFDADRARAGLRPQGAREATLETRLLLLRAREREIATLRERLDDAGVDARERQILVLRIARLEREVEMLRRRIEQLDEVIRDR